MKRTMKSSTFFTPDEQGRIAEAIGAVEKTTIGEIAVMIVDSSDRYREAEILGGFFLAGLLSFVLSLSLFHASLWTYIPLSFLFVLPAAALLREVPVLKKPFISGRRFEDAVRQRAVSAFYEKGLHRTRKNTGVLVFISLLERKVWILADTGIYEKITQETLQGFADGLIRGIREHEPCRAICQVIGDVGSLLSRHFPVTRDDIDELTNRVITEED